MFGWFRGKPECPVDPATRDWIDRRWAWLEHEFGVERLRNAPLVLPSPEFFPGRYDGTDEDVRQLLDRVCAYMDVDPNLVEMSIFEDRNPVNDGYPDVAGLYHAASGRFRVWLEETNLHDPLALVATMAHELGHVHLLGHGRISPEADDHESLTDLLTVYFGLGVLRANSVIREQYWQEGHWAGWSIGRRGYLGMSEYGYAFALYARGRAEDGSKWARELRLDVRTAFKQAMQFLAEHGQSAG